MLRGILDTPERYLLAAPRTALIDEHSDWLRAEASARGIALVVEAVHSAQKRPDTARRVADACHALSGVCHAALLITHEALRSTDLGPFTEQAQPWHARIDEVPDALAAGSFAAPAAASYLAMSYDLAPSEVEGWWRTSLKPDAPALGALLRDTHLRELVGFDKSARALHGRALVDIGDWRDATLAGREVRWYAAWTPAALDGFASVEIAGANFETSLCGLASLRLDGDRVGYEYHRLGGDRSAYPSVVIRYFTRGHVGSTTWWATTEGKSCLNAVVRHLRTVPDLGFYSGNQVVLDYFQGWLDAATAVSPKQAGTNRLIQHESCAFIYSSKAVPSDAAIRSALGLTVDEIERAREIEDVIQFVLRGALRDPAFDGQYRIYLYDYEQAIALRRYLIETNIAASVRLESVEEAGIIDVVRAASARRLRADPTSAGQTFEERRQERLDADAARKRRERERRKIERQAEGTYRPRGRPSKDGGCG